MRVDLVNSLRALASSNPGALRLRTGTGEREHNAEQQSEAKTRQPHWGTVIATCLIPAIQSASLG
jgi:hypothetical protein